MTRDDIMHLVNETAPRYQSWGIEAHFQLFAQRLLQIEREACIAACEQVARLNSEQACLDGSAAAHECAGAIRDRGHKA